MRSCFARNAERTRRGNSCFRSRHRTEDGGAREGRNNGTSRTRERERGETGKRTGTGKGKGRMKGKGRGRGRGRGIRDGDGDGARGRGKEELFSHRRMLRWLG